MNTRRGSSALNGVRLCEGTQIQARMGYHDHADVLHPFALIESEQLLVLLDAGEEKQPWKVRVWER